MPFYWVNSVFMIFFILVTLVFFYFYKNVEDMMVFDKNGEVSGNYSFMW
uniref:ATP synthase F0 subunit 8 n=1 Tax=Lycosa grahami TaxID=3013956 RepID=A0A9E9JMP7_9ARAC|nr:ATP synthase F0 subunit 8 [Lycosa grahami]WAQ70318.1 ATP synthase F0 subunit 8 [Lycosa grahami]